MKPSETNPWGKRKGYWAIAIMCLVYAGITLLIFFNLSYTAYTRGHFDSAMMNSSDIRNESLRENLRSRQNFIVFPLLLTFTGALISFVAGISLISLLRMKDNNELRRDVIDSMILPDEKIVIKELEKSNGELTQSELVRKTGFSKVKVHRIVRRLESLGIIKKLPYGITNKIRLEKSLNEP